MLIWCEYSCCCCLRSPFLGLCVSSFTLWVPTLHTVWSQFHFAFNGVNTVMFSVWPELWKRVEFSALLTVLTGPLWDNWMQRCMSTAMFPVWPEPDQASQGCTAGQPGLSRMSLGIQCVSCSCWNIASLPLHAPGIVMVCVCPEPDHAACCGAVRQPC